VLDDLMAALRRRQPQAARPSAPASTNKAPAQPPRP
jgi:hypothetical protein